ncbi:Putative 4-hydroxy-4-methyl-2-oxoglutarate aldolase [Pseudomonas fluorescens]|uniref:4-hydroxy-4-methyl-2-oxoglutarate aldolase n=1 Tax=Pseudomonas fluorescens TaxID=294 RepID=A0A5E7TD52_PSEFL|nr:ribonuclease E activity regulator RraA [Pseudomonas fluorescens]VVP93643.1 Putative 4-hydroxy-4-methyl-2-oxoglutarate aldolase [Pseudomonas fluorescens]
MTFSTADLCDRHAPMLIAGDVRVLPGKWAWFGAARRCHGEVVTLRAEGCNGEIRTLLRDAGHGRVLVIDAGLNPLALLGDNLAALAGRNGWAGVVINGNLRDTQALARIRLGILATGCWPVRSNNENGGILQETLNIRGIEVSPGDWLYADEDGVLLSRTALVPATEDGRRSAP